MKQRIAVVAVSALTAGVFSVVSAPVANAAVTAAVAYSAPSYTTVVGAPISIPVRVQLTDAPPTSDAVVLTLTNPTKPATATVTIAGTALSEVTNSRQTPALGTAALQAVASTTQFTFAVASATVTATKTSAGSLGTGAVITPANIVFNPKVAGSYTFTVTPTIGTGFAGTLAAGTITINVTLPTASVVGKGAIVRQDVANSTSQITSAGVAVLGKLQFISGPSDQSASGLTTGAYFTSASTGVVVGELCGTISTCYNFVPTTVGITDGTYTFRAFDDIDGDGKFNAGDLGSTLLTIQVAVGVAGATGLALQKTTVDVGSGGTGTTNYSYSIVDADGNPSYLVGAEAMTGSVTATGSTTSLVGAGAGVYFEFVDNGAGAGAVVITGDNAGTPLLVPSGTYTVGITGTGALATYGSTATLTIVRNTGYVVGMTATSTPNLVFDTTNNGVATSTISDATISAAAGATSISFSFTGANYVAGSAIRVPVTITRAIGTSVTAISAPSLASVNPDGTGTFSVTNAAPTAGDSYTVKVPTNSAQSTYVGFTVTYASGAPIFRAVNVAPAASFTVKNGSTNTVSAILDNGFDVAQVSKVVTISVTGRNPSTSQASTDATGKVSYALTDVPAVATATTDTVVFSHAYINALGAAATATTTFTITYNATGVVVGNVLVTAANATRTVDTVEQFAGQPAATAKTVYTATVSDATGLPLPAGNVVTFSAGAGDIFLNGVKTAVTDASGQASVTIYRKLIGYGKVTATIAGKSGSLNTTLWSTTPRAGNNTDVNRNIDVSVTGNAESGGIIRVTASVTDRHGNAVTAVPLTLSITGAGRLYTGEVASGASVVTNTAGQFQWNITSAATETGDMTVKVSMSGGQSLDLADYITVPGGSSSVLVSGVKAGNDEKSVTARFIPAAVGTTNADVLKSIVALIASINKQIQALQKLILKR